jgi:hypothetical protein
MLCFLRVSNVGDRFAKCGFYLPDFDDSHHYATFLWYSSLRSRNSFHNRSCCSRSALICLSLTEFVAFAT